MTKPARRFTLKQLLVWVSISGVALAFLGTVVRSNDFILTATYFVTLQVLLIVLLVPRI